jgi:hypothetical protein
MIPITCRATKRNTVRDLRSERPNRQQSRRIATRIQTHTTSADRSRTLAWFIARQPGGSIAGAIAYRHHSVRMFEGYAGTSASGFRAEVEAEQALARGEDLALMVERHEHEHLAGPAADEACARLGEYDRQLRFQGIIPGDRRQFAKLITQHDPHVYPGRFVTCVHNPDRALCHNGNQTDPSLSDCQPLTCRNVALTKDNLTAWHNQLTKVDRSLETGELLAPYVHERLRIRRDQIRGHHGVKPSTVTETDIQVVADTLLAETPRRNRQTHRERAGRPRRNHPPNPLPQLPRTD